MAEQVHDYYEILGVPRDADERTIKEAFRELALKYHPDRSTEPDAEERFKEIAEAYAILSDPRKRAEYDRLGHIGVAGFSTEDLFATIDFDDLFGGFGSEFRSGFGGGLFDSFFGGPRAGPSRGRDLRAIIEVPLAVVLEGGEREVQVDRPRTCAACGGSGAAAGTAPRACEACGGSGQVVTTGRKGTVSVQQIATCPSCGGAGSFVDDPCTDCEGRGLVGEHETLKVKVPVGVDEGTMLRVPGHGMPSEHAGQPPGDLLVVVTTEADPRFRRHGADLWHLATLSVPDAVLGQSLEVPTLEEAIEVTVPAGTQSETVLRVPGKGLPRFGGGPRGDLLVEIRVELPRSLSRHERRLYEELREIGGTEGR